MNGAAAGLGRVLLRAFPPDFRKRFGEELLHHLSTRSREIRERRGRGPALLYFMKSTLDMTAAAAAERRDQRLMKTPDPGRGSRTDLGHDIRFAFRTLRRSPGFTVVAVLTLALGIGGTTAMFSVLNSAMFRPLPFPRANELVMGRATFSGDVNPWVAFPDYMDYRDQAASISSLATIAPGARLVTVTGSDEPEEARATFVTANFFSTLGVQPILGGSFTIEELPAEGTGQVVISHDFWQRWYGGDPDVVGKTLIARGGPSTVMGVMPPGFRFMFDADLWSPPWPGNSSPITRRYHNWLLVGRLADGATVSEAQAEVDVISAQLEAAYPDSNRDKALQVDGLQNALLEGYESSLLLLMGAIVLVLLIACSNVASLLMARGSVRTAEMAVRASLGAGKGRLARQLLVECVILALLAGALGVVLAVWLQDLILGLLPMDRLDFSQIGMSGEVLGGALLLSLVTVLIFGAFPSLATARANPAQDLREGGRSSGSRAGVRFRSGLVVLQVALSLILLVGSGLLIRSFSRLRGVDPGYRTENLLTAAISLPSERYPDREVIQQFYEELRDRVEGLPGVQSVALINQLPILQPSGNVGIWDPEHPPETNQDATWADRRVIFPGYFGTMEIPLLRGRSVRDTDIADSPPVIVLSRATAENIFPDADPLGRTVAVDMGSDEPGLFQVVGVVENHQTSSVAQSYNRPIMFFSYHQMVARTMRIAVAADGEAMALFRPIQERVWELDPDLVVSNPLTMEDAVANSIGSTRALTIVLAVFASVAMALAALGLYGVLAFLVTKRAREIGIRLALGASGGKVMRLVLSRGMVLVLGGTVLGIAGALGAAGMVEDLLFQTDPRDPATYAGVTAFFLLVALGACLIPGWRALKVDPVEAFRIE